MSSMPEKESLRVNNVKSLVTLLNSFKKGIVVTSHSRVAEE